MTATAKASEVRPRWSSTFDSFPVAMFGSVMGLTGLSVAWRMAALQYGAPAWVAGGLAAFAIADFLLVVAAYATKIVSARYAVLREFDHPVARNTFATFFVSLLLLPLVLAPLNLSLARVVWAAGALGICALNWTIVYGWLRTPHQVADATPAWMLSIVGLLDMPLAVPHLGLPGLEPVMVVGLAIGLFLAIPVFMFVLARLVFGPSLPQVLEPSLLILVAPFAVGMSTYVATTRSLDLFASSLFVPALFVLSLLLPKLRHLPGCCPFRISWWAVSFPLAATAIAALQFAAARPAPLTHLTALALLGLSTSVIVWLLARTASGVLRGELRSLSA